uniref:RNA-directed DNA polymerase, eukaryota n=1 Tax=Tanacetum cinerariifolium TaxID=118510 RepID=A0A6L2JR59_TANCI|nr:hypothetical protein [Tanacetum cinerariifolium]
METKDTLPSCSNSEAQQMQQIQDKAKMSCMAIPEFRDTLIQQLESVKKSIDERVKLKREYESWVNERQMQTTEEKVNTSQELDASSVDTESSRTESKEKDTSSRSGNDAHADDADIRPIYDEEPMAEVQTTAEIDVFAIGQQHTEQPEFNNEGEACIKWDIEGHESSKFFHGLIKKKMRAQMIHGIMKEGVWISDHSQIKEEFLNFFKEGFKDHDSNVGFPPFANSSRLCALDRDSLETPVSLDEVKNAV